MTNRVAIISSLLVVTWIFSYCLALEGQQQQQQQLSQPKGYELFHTLAQLKSDNNIIATVGNVSGGDNGNVVSGLMKKTQIERNCNAASSAFSNVVVTFPNWKNKNIKDTLLLEIRGGAALTKKSKATPSTIATTKTATTKTKTNKKKESSQQLAQNNEQQYTRQRKLTLLLVAIALFNDTLQLTMILPIIHTLVTSPPPLGVESNTEVALGIFFASKDICQMSFAPLAGILTSKTSPNVALMTSTIGLGLATFVFAGATTFWQLLMARAAQGIASAAVLCGGMSLIAETHTADVRGSAIGIAQTGLALGLLCGPLIGGLLFEKVGRPKTFRLAATFVLINALGQLALMLLAPPSSLSLGAEKNTKNENTSNKKIKKGNKKEINKAIKTNDDNNNIRLIRNHDVLTILASTLAVHAVVGVIKPLSQVILDREFGISMLGRSFVVTIATVTYFISTPISGWLSDRIPSRSKLVAISLVTMALSSLFFALRRYGLWAFNLSVALLGTSMGMAGSAGQALLADLVDRHQLGDYSMVFALSDMADSLGLIVGPIFGLYLSQVFGPSAGPGAMGVLCLLLAPVVLRIP